MRLVIPLLLLFPLAACSSNSDEPGAAPSSSADPQAALHSAVQAYSDAYLTGDSEGAYALLSDRCRKQYAAKDFSVIVDQAGELYGSALPIKSFDADVSGDMARVSYTYETKALNQDSEPWVLEGGKWLEDDC